MKPNEIIQQIFYAALSVLILTGALSLIYLFITEGGI